MGKDERGRAKAQREFYRREAERRARKAKAAADQSPAAKGSSGDSGRAADESKMREGRRPPFA
jgi:hypothetical protein